MRLWGRVSWVQPFGKKQKEAGSSGKVRGVKILSNEQTEILVTLRGRSGLTRGKLTVLLPDQVSTQFFSLLPSLVK